MDQLINFIIRPPRAEYDPKHDLLEQEFLLRGKWYQRKDLEVKNCRGEVIQCSHYVPISSPEEKPLPCVIYCHGNSGCRAEASEAAIMILPSNITVFTLDFSGSGLSDGEHVTLGWNEKDDLKAAVDYLRQNGNVSLIGLWGRSMGAVTSLLYGAEDPSIAGMVLDSPFSDLVDLMMELVDAYKVPVPKFTVKFVIQYMRKAIQKKANFDIAEMNTIKVAKSCFVPALFGHAIADDFIQPHHSDRLFEAYMGDKNIIKFEGDHNSPRPQFYFDSINIFFHNVLHPPEDKIGATYVNMEHDNLGKVPSAIASAKKQSEAENEETDDDKLPSSSRMISFGPSEGQPYGPLLRRTMSDDQFVEYELDDLAGFPCDEEEEERMFMEAVIQSLKDMEMQQKLSMEGQLDTSNPASIEALQGPSTKELAVPATSNANTVESFPSDGEHHSCLPEGSSNL